MLPRVPVHQWVLSLLYRLRYLVAWDHRLCRPRCTGRLRLVATVEDPQAVRALLESLGVAAEAPRPAPPRPP